MQAAGLQNLKVYMDGEDPYITLPVRSVRRHPRRRPRSRRLTRPRGRSPVQEEIEGDAEDDEDFTIKPTDALVLAAKMEEDFSALEVHIYEADTGNFYGAGAELCGLVAVLALARHRARSRATLAPTRGPA